MSALPKVSSTLSANGVEVGRVKALWRYPVKSMGAEPLQEVELSRRGLVGDRRWAFFHDGKARSGCPWLTISQRPDMSQYFPLFVEPERPDASPIIVRTPSGRQFDVVDPALAVELGGGVHAMKSDRGVFDEMPLALLTTQSMSSLATVVHTTLDARRFRPNLLIEAASDEPFPEDAWVGSILRIGGAQVRAELRDVRCVVVNFDPTTAEHNPTILRAIAREREVCLGIYGSTVTPGIVAVGDPVLICL